MRTSIPVLPMPQLDRLNKKQATTPAPTPETANRVMRDLLSSERVVDGIVTAACCTAARLVSAIRYMRNPCIEDSSVYNHSDIYIGERWRVRWKVLTAAEQDVVATLCDEDLRIYLARHYKPDVLEARTIARLGTSLRMAVVTLLRSAQYPSVPLQIGNHHT